MKITIEHCGEKALWESNRHGQIDNLMAIDDTSIEEAFYSFIGLLIVCGWQMDAINEQILLMAKEIKE